MSTIKATFVVEGHESLKRALAGIRAESKRTSRASKKAHEQVAGSAQKAAREEMSAAKKTSRFISRLRRREVAETRRAERTKTKMMHASSKSNKSIMGMSIGAIGAAGAALTGVATAISTIDKRLGSVKNTLSSITGLDQDADAGSIRVGARLEEATIGIASKQLDENASATEIKQQAEVIKKAMVSGAKEFGVDPEQLITALQTAQNEYSDEGGVNYLLQNLGKMQSLALGTESDIETVARAVFNSIRFDKISASEAPMALAISRMQDEKGTIPFEEIQKNTKGSHAAFSAFTTASDMSGLDKASEFGAIIQTIGSATKSSNVADSQTRALMNAFIKQGRTGSVTSIIDELTSQYKRGDAIDTQGLAAELGGNTEAANAVMNIMQKRSLYDKLNNRSGAGAQLRKIDALAEAMSTSAIGQERTRAARMKASDVGEYANTQAGIDRVQDVDQILRGSPLGRAIGPLIPDFIKDSGGAIRGQVTGKQDLRNNRIMPVKLASDDIEAIGRSAAKATQNTTRSTQAGGPAKR